MFSDQQVEFPMCTKCLMFVENLLRGMNECSPINKLNSHLRMLSDRVQVEFLFFLQRYPLCKIE
jgi:hypothetical protein